MGDPSLLHLAEFGRPTGTPYLFRPDDEFQVPSSPPGKSAERIRRGSTVLSALLTERRGGIVFSSASENRSSNAIGRNTAPLRENNEFER